MRHPAVFLQSLRGAPGAWPAKRPAIEAERKGVDLAGGANRAAERVFGVTRQTIARRLGKKAAALPPPPERNAAARRKSRRARTRRTLGLRRLQAQPALGVDRLVSADSRQIAAHFVGDRCAQSARAFRERIPPPGATAAGPAAATFGWPCAEVFPKRTPRVCSCIITTFHPVYNHYLPPKLNNQARTWQIPSPTTMRLSPCVELFISDESKRCTPPRSKWPRA